MKKSEQYLADGSDYLLSLTKINGNPVQDILGYVSLQFGNDTPVFEISKIVFKDGTAISVDGEHDIAYIPFDEEIPWLKVDFLHSIED